LIPALRRNFLRENNARDISLKVPINFHRINPRLILFKYCSKDERSRREESSPSGDRVSKRIAKQGRGGDSSTGVFENPESRSSQSAAPRVSDFNDFSRAGLASGFNSQFNSRGIVAKILSSREGIAKRSPRDTSGMFEHRSRVSLVESLLLER